MATWPCKFIGYLAGSGAAPTRSKATHVMRARTGTVWPAKQLGVGASVQPIYGAVGDLSAKLTTAGRILNARQLVEGLSFQAVEFAVGTGGYYPGNPVQAIPVNPASTGLQNEVLRKGFSEIEHPIPESISLYCRLEKLEAPYALGELMIVVEILDSPSDPSEVGQKICYALVNFPIDAHNLSKVCAWRVAITY